MGSCTRLFMIIVRVLARAVANCSGDEERVPSGMTYGSSECEDTASISLVPCLGGRRTFLDDCQGGGGCSSRLSLAPALFPPNHDFQLPFLLGVRGRPSSSGVRMVVEPLDEEEEELTRSLATRGGKDGAVECFLERERNTLDFLWTRPGEEVGASELSVRLEEAAKTEASLRIGVDGGGGERSGVDKFRDALQMGLPTRASVAHLYGSSLPN